MDYIISGFIQAFRLLFSGDAQTYSAISVTVRLTCMSMVASLLVGVPLGFILGYFDFKGKRPLRLMVDTALALPTLRTLLQSFPSARSGSGSSGLGSSGHPGPHHQRRGPGGGIAEPDAGSFGSLGGDVGSCPALFRDPDDPDPAAAGRLGGRPDRGDVRPPFTRLGSGGGGVLQLHHRPSPLVSGGGSGATGSDPGS